MVDTYSVDPAKRVLNETDLHQQPTEIAEGISDLQFIFTTNKNGMLENVPAEEIHDWSTVIGVAMRFLVSSSPYQKVWYAYINV